LSIESRSTKVVVLGVSHSAQLAAEQYQPAMFRAYFDRVSPAAICVERSPEEFARSDHYEYTYEIQHLTLPYARARGIPVYPVDWVPGSDDQLLAWGLPDLEQPLFVRNTRGFRGFTCFTEDDVLELTLFFSEEKVARSRV